jgi:hypothetical protein
MSIYSLEEDDLHYFKDPFDNFMFKETRPWVHSKSMIKRSLNKYKLKIKRMKILF